ncbi:phospholipase B1, membrane-associated-like [Leptopilina boulardi]|uniref:phospholipase B1, membrane-associated-like n=1 Tax=Leptopilina boulardi TaxID=63433 RepID=UPI0021F62EA6|nr:phospholipase B1, membrane-associated-like [Leptopilina boulardi]
MKFMYFLTFIFSLYICLNCQKTFLDSVENIRLFRQFKNWTLRMFEKMGEKEKMREEAEKLHKIQDPVSKNVPFPCNLEGTRSLNVPISVHKLRPGDIDIYAALGDSLTAGSGALGTKLFHLLIDNRGVSFLGGGEKTWREYLTVANILKEFNPKLFGYSKTDSMTFEESAQFNLATLGATSDDLPFMAESLVKLMKNDSRVDMKNHWKFISIMIGANDFCSHMCYLENPSLIIDYHESNLTVALRIIRDNLPRTFIALVPPPHIWTVMDVDNKEPYCQFILEIECPCFFGPMTNNHNQKELFDIMTRFQLLEEEIANRSEFQRDDFTVVYTPFTVNLSLRNVNDDNIPKSHLSVDCFHISQKTNARSANAVWNLLLMPVGEKSAVWQDPFKRFNCPTPTRPYIYTSRNSNKIDLR